MEGKTEERRNEHWVKVKFRSTRNEQAEESDLEKAVMVWGVRLSSST